jgi:hypothetical protein
VGERCRVFCKERDKVRFVNDGHQRFKILPTDMLFQTRLLGKIAAAQAASVRALEMALKKLPEGAVPVSTETLMDLGTVLFQVSE